MCLFPHTRMASSRVLPGGGIIIPPRGCLLQMEGKPLNDMRDWHCAPIKGLLTSAGVSLQSFDVSPNHEDPGRSTSPARERVEVTLRRRVHFVSCSFLDSIERQAISRSGRYRPRRTTTGPRDALSDSVLYLSLAFGDQNHIPCLKITQHMYRSSKPGATPSFPPRLLGLDTS